MAELDPADPLTWHFQATLHLYLRDIDGYRRDCREIVARFLSTTALETAQQAAMTCLLAPTGIDDPARLLDSMQRLNNSNGAGNWFGWNALTLGMGYYRPGKYAEALAALAPVSSDSNLIGSSALAFRAMAHHQLNQYAEARNSLDDARSRLARKVSPGPEETQSIWWNWLHCQIFVRDAEALIPAVPNDGPTVATSAQADVARRERKSARTSLPSKPP